MRRLALPALLFGALLLAGPALAGGDAETVYVYESTPVNVSDAEEVEHLSALDGVHDATGEQLEVVREGNASWPTDDVPPHVVELRRALRNGQFVADDPGDTYYRVHSHEEGGELVMRSEPVSAREVAEFLAHDDIGDASFVASVARTGRGTTTHEYDAALVRGENEYVLVEQVGTRTERDENRLLKLVGYASGAALLVGGVVGLRS